MPEIQVLQVQYLVKYLVELVGVLVANIGGAMDNLGVGIAAQSGDPKVMAELTTGIFGTNSGLFYWMNGWLFDFMTRLPYADLGTGLHALLSGLRNGVTG